MPHNRTRIWVGLAIAAVTIPAVGTLIYNATGNGLQAGADDGPVRWTAAGGRTRSALRLATRERPRDYQAELDAALSRQPATYPEAEAYANLFADDNPIFDVSPFEEYADDDFIYEERLRDLPDPAEELAPVEVEVEGDVAEDDLAIEFPPADRVAGLSDRAVYTMVIDELSPEERDDFARAWAIMSVGERADLLDEFRARIEE